MYINLGGGYIMRARDVIGVFDMDTATVSRTTKRYLQSRERDEQLEYASVDLPRSFIVKGNGKVIISDLNPKTVCARMPRKERK